MNKWLFHQNGLTRASLSATVTGVSNFVEENVFLFLHRQVSPSRCIQSLIAQRPTRQICQSQCTQHVQSIE